MKAMRVEPVASAICPDYPGKNEPVAVGRAMEAWFSPMTLAVAGLSGLALMSLGTARGSEEESADVSEKQIRAILDKYLKDYVAPDEKSDEITFQSATSPIAGNPPLTQGFNGRLEKEGANQQRNAKGFVATRVFYPDLDLEKARSATRELFQLYGIRLKENQPLKTGEATFEADGFHPDRKIGFEIVDENAFEHGGDGVVSNGSQVLDAEKEYAALSVAVQKGELQVLVVSPRDLAVSEVDDHTLMKAYLQSVVDYLEWLRKNGKLG